MGVLCLGTYARATYVVAALGQGPKGPELVVLHKFKINDCENRLKSYFSGIAY